VCNCFTVKVFVSNFKVEKSENLDNAFYVFYVFLTWHFKKTYKVAFFGFSKKRKKRILELWRSDSFFVSNFVAMATRVSGLVLLKFDWHHLIAWPRKPAVIHKRLRDISCTSRVIADFVLNFVAMATGVGRGRICLASFNSPPTNTPY